MKMQNSKIKIQNYIFLIIFLGSLFFPLMSFAGTYQYGSDTATYHGLVPCGKAQAEPGESAHVTRPCQLCHLFVMLKGVIDFALWLCISVAVLMFVVAGFLMIVSYFGGLESLTGGQKGGPVLFSRAKKILNSVVIGLVIIFGSWIIINTVFMAMGVAEWTELREGWFQVSCPIQ